MDMLRRSDCSALVGTWMTTSHLAASLLQTLYGATPADAASVASIIPLASALVRLTARQDSHRR